MNFTGDGTSIPVSLTVILSCIKIRLNVITAPVRRMTDYSVTVSSQKRISKRVLCYVIVSLLIFNVGLQSGFCFCWRFDVNPARCKANVIVRNLRFLRRWRVQVVVFCFVTPCLEGGRTMPLRITTRRQNSEDQGKIKVKLPLWFFLTDHAVKAYLGSGGIAPSILDLSTRRWWAVSFMPRPIFPQGKNPWYPLYRRLCGPQSPSGRGKGKGKFIPVLN